MLGLAQEKLSEFLNALERCPILIFVVANIELLLFISFYFFCLELKVAEDASYTLSAATRRLPCMHPCLDPRNDSSEHGVYRGRRHREGWGRAGVDGRSRFIH